MQPLRDILRRVEWRGLIAGCFLGAFVLALIVPPGPSARDLRHLQPIVRDNIAFPGRTMFGPYTCTTDWCEGHFAGWHWAAERDLRNPDDCGGSGSDSFLEGCMYYLEISGRVPGEW